MLVLALLILAGCGGSPHGKSQLVTGHGFAFRAPAGWRVATLVSRASASHDSELVQATTFPLVRPYTDSLFDEVAGELAERMRTLAKQVGGTVGASRTTTVDGIRSHSYDVQVAGHVDEYTFVLRGKREFQLLCRRRSSSSSEACDRLLTSFRLA